MSGFSWNPLTDIGNIYNGIFPNEPIKGVGYVNHTGAPTPSTAVVGLPGNPGGLLGASTGTPTSGPTYTVTTPAANLSFLPWAAGYTAFALVILGTQDMGDNASKLGVAFAWLVTGYVVLTRYSMIASGFSNLFGHSG